MALITNARTSFDAGALTKTGTVKEDVSDIIYNISPTDTPFLSAAKRKDVSNINFEWNTEALPSPSDSNKQLEGDTFTADAAIGTTRESNTCQISWRNASVTGTQNATANYGKSEEMAHQLTLAGRILKNDVEAALVSDNPKIVGSNTVARQTRGLEHWIRTNVSDQSKTYGIDTSDVTANTDGATPALLTEATLEGVLQTGYSNGAEPDTLMVGPFNKRVISNFVGRASARTMVDANTVTSNVTLFASDFGDLKVVINRKQRERTALLLDFDYVSVAFLRNFMQQDIAKVGDADRKQLIVEYGLCVENEKALGAVFDITSSGATS